MASSSFRRFDVQAKYAMWLAIIAIAPFAAALACVLRNYNDQLGQIIYGKQTAFLPVLITCVALSGLLAAGAFFLGLNSAGQRRNDTPGRSWFGFFVGGSIVTLDVIILLAWFMLKIEQPV